MKPAGENGRSALASCDSQTASGRISAGNGMTAYITGDRIILWFQSAENLTHDAWESLLDELNSNPIPGLYQVGRRSHASIEPGGMTRVVIYLTAGTVTPEGAKAVLRKRNVKLVDEMGLTL